MEVLPSEDLVKDHPVKTLKKQEDQPTPSTSDVEKQPVSPSEAINASKTSAFKSLGLLDRFLALWIFLAMAVGIILGNFVSNTGPALQKGKFVGVSVPIGMFPSFSLPQVNGRKLNLADEYASRWVVGYDVSDSL